MYANENTLNHLHKRPGWCGYGGICLSVSMRLTRMSVSNGVDHLAIAKEQFYAYEGDLGMT